MDMKIYTEHCKPKPVRSRLVKTTASHLDSNWIEGCARFEGTFEASCREFISCFAIWRQAILELKFMRLSVDKVTRWEKLCLHVALKHCRDFR